MLTMHPTLLIGPADWDEARMPREEFRARIAALWDVCDRDTAGALVFGSSRHHAELAWLTHFTPKLEPGLAAIAKGGTLRLFVGGGVNMLPAAQPLTWVTELLPLRAAAATVAQWTSEIGGALRLALIGGDTMPFDLYREIVANVAAAGARDVTPRLATLMGYKSVRELDAIREACTSLDVAVTALQAAWRSGAGVTDAVLAGEQAAHRRGAQAVRSLFSLDGGRTLVPFTAAETRRVDPLQAYMAVRQCGYWAEGFALLATTPGAGVASVRRMLRDTIAAVRPGVRREVLDAALTPAGQQDIHPAVAGTCVAAMGLDLEAPRFGGRSQDVLAPDAVYSLRAGISTVGILSAMIVVTAGGAEVLWAAP